MVYDNSSIEDWICLEYDGHFKDEEGYIIITSGFSVLNCNQDNKRCIQDRTFLFRIDDSGNCHIIREWQFQISSPNSMAALNGFVYFGQNKMITRVNLESGERIYLTNKSDEEIAALKRII